ncbi:Sensor histidine kinase [Acidisarcina polymorpha]|uniref:Sensor histidine kinase n=2 Tax=Acidisarcina polymorpha TaxID=2211140 RepID=A0A2Z5FU59_9BACT|nr:Sensor histidine kinase [Acidisarcina polymorpha]
MLPTSLVAQSLPLSHFQHTAWTLQDGAPSQIDALAQTKDGYIWLGTVNGLFRFNGIRFEPYKPSGGQQLAHTGVRSLLATDDGGLWIGYIMGKTSFLKDGILQNQRLTRHAHGGGTVFSIITDPDGSLWSATYEGLMHFFAGEWHDADEAAGLDIKTCYFLYKDRSGTLWLATNDFVYRLDRGSKHLVNTGINGGPDAVFTDGPDGAVWIADRKGLYGVTDQKSPNRSSRHIIPYKDTATDLRFDNTGALWALGAKTGITRIRQPNDAIKPSPAGLQGDLEHFSLKDGLSSERGLASFKDREGNIWIATSDGLDRFRVMAFDPAPLPASFGQYMIAAPHDGSLLIGTESDGLQVFRGGKVSKVKAVTLKDIACLYPASDGKLWLGGTGDLGYLKGDQFVAVPIPAKLKSLGRDTQSMTSAPGGDLLMQADARLEILRLHEGQWSELPNPDGFGPAMVMSTDNSGRVWAGYEGGIVTIFKDGKRRTFNKESGVTIGNVTALYASGDTMWMGGEHGLEVMRSDHPVAVKFAGPTSIDGVSGIIQMEDGSMWINALPGVLRISAEEIKQSAKDPSHPMQYELFNYLDGISGQAPQIRGFPSVVRGIGHILWFATTNGVASVDTSNLHRNPLPPPVSIEDLVVDGRALNVDRAALLRKGSQNVQIDYTALSLSVPQRVLFRYRLDGYDKQWQDAGIRRQALYSHLPPGHYTFHVIACNNDGVWNNAGASLTFYLPPTFFQSWYFKGVVAIAVAATFWFLYLRRLKQETSKVQERLYERFSERERIARDLHDTFFQGIQGLLLSVQSAVRRLPEGDENKTALEETLAQSDSVMSQGRELVFNLRVRSRDAQDLGSQLEASAKEFARYYPSEFSLIVLGEPKALYTHVCEELCKLSREALCNAYRHAQADHVEARIEYRLDVLRLSVSDDGMGIDEEIVAEGAVDNHWGLPGMKERASSIGATFRVVSGRGSGTIIQVELPSQVAYSHSVSGPVRSFMRAFKRSGSRGTSV